MRLPRLIPPTLLLLTAWASGGCFLFRGSPSEANRQLRIQNQQFQTQLATLARQHEADQSVILALRQRGPGLPTLPADRLARLFTVHNLKFGRLTGGADLDPAKPGDEGLKVYLIPTDDDGQPIKAAGSIKVEAFDLASPADPLVGHWEFDLVQSRQLWGGSFLETGYVLTCPWQKPPAHGELTVKVVFTDELTQSPFAAQRTVTIRPPPATVPATNSTTRPGG